MDKPLRLAKLLVSVGALLTIVPVGFMTVSVIVLQPDPWKALMSLGWALIVAIALLPLGLAFLFGGLGWLIAVKRQLKKEFEDDDEDAGSSA
ncbi:MAG: hypothetical protein OHK005_14820 [Candidatus Methylacidiphilales bacterium]